MWWNSSTSLTQAYDIYKRGVGNETKRGQINGFVWRAMLLPPCIMCVFEPVWILMKPNYDIKNISEPFLFVGSHHEQLCKTPDMIDVVNKTEGYTCKKECYDMNPTKFDAALTTYTQTKSYNQRLEDEVEDCTQVLVHHNHGKLEKGWQSDQYVPLERSLFLNM